MKTCKKCGRRVLYLYQDGVCIWCLRGYTKKELTEYIETLNNSLQPVELSGIQFQAITDAIKRTGGLLNEAVSKSS